VSKTFLLATVAILTIMLTATIILAVTPVKQVSLQGRLSDPSGKPLDGAFSVKFTIFNDPTATDPSNMLWSEAQKVTVTKGLFGVNLGSATQGGIPLAFDKPYWVEVSIGAEKLTPRYPLTSAPYSFYGGVAGNIDASKIIGTLNINQIPALTADKILSVNPSTIVGTIPDSKISSVSVSKLYYTTLDKSGQTVTNPGIPATSIKGTLNSEQIPALDAGKIPVLDINTKTSGTLLAARIQALTAAQIPALDAGKITTGAFAPDRIPGIDAAKIISNTFATDRIPGLDAAKIISGTFGTARLTDGAVTGAKIANDAVTGTKILDKTIENGDIADGAINTYKILDGGIRHQDIAPSEITKDLIDRGAVTVEKLDKAYLAGQSQYVVKVGPGADQRTKIASDLLFTYGIFTASCTCSVPDDGTHKVYFCNCWVANDAGTINAYANVFQSNGYAQTNAAIDWIIVER
jgi:hypothetical protein